MELTLIELVFLMVWTILGSILGFFSFTYSHEVPMKINICRCILSIGIGLFVSIPIAEYLIDGQGMCHHLGMMLGGIGAFGLPDIIKKYWPKVISMLLTGIGVRLTGGMMGGYPTYTVNPDEPTFNHVDE